MKSEEMMTKLGASKLPDDERHVCKVIVDAYAEVTDEETYLEVRRDISQALNRIGNPHLNPYWPETPFEKRMRNLFLLGNEVYLYCETEVRKELRQKEKSASQEIHS